MVVFIYGSCKRYKTILLFRSCGFYSYFMELFYGFRNPPKTYAGRANGLVLVSNFPVFCLNARTKVTLRNACGRTQSGRDSATRRRGRATWSSWWASTDRRAITPVSFPSRCLAHWAANRECPVWRNFPQSRKLCFLIKAYLVLWSFFSNRMSSRVSSNIRIKWLVPFWT